MGIDGHCSAILDEVLTLSSSAGESSAAKAVGEARRMVRDLWGENANFPQIVSAAVWEHRGSINVRFLIAGEKVQDGSNLASPASAAAGSAAEQQDGEEGAQQACRRALIGLLGPHLDAWARAFIRSRAPSFISASSSAGAIRER